MVKLTHRPDEPAEQPADRSPEQTEHHPRRGRRLLKFFLLSVFVLTFFGSGWFTYKIAAATNKIFTKNTTGGSPLLHGKEDELTNRINILLLGIGGEGHDGPNLTDTIQVASIDPKAHTVAMLSIPRDLYVQVPNSATKVKINEVHAIGEDNGYDGGGPALDKALIAKILDVPIHYFVRVDFSGFEQMVNAVGGVDITVKDRLYDPYYPLGESHGYEVLDVQPGLHHMNGSLALKYARSRETTSDFDRSKRQQEVMVALRDKATSLQVLTNPGKISSLIDALGDHLKTDLTLREAEKLAKIVRDIPATAVQSKVLDNGPQGLLYDSVGPGGSYILLPRAGDYTEIRQFANQIFNGANITAEHANLELLNSSGYPGLANQEAEALRSYGYLVGDTGNGPRPATETVIYDYTDGQKSNTVEALKKRYKARVIKLSGGAPKPGIDIRVIIGSNYANEINAPADNNLYSYNYTG